MNCNIQKIDNYNLKVTINVQEEVQNRKLYYIAAAPYDRRATYTGSGLPFPNAQVAFENTPNLGEAELDIQNRCVIELMTPNSYMENLGTITIPPTLFIKYKTLTGDVRDKTVKLVEGVPYRMLTYPEGRTSADFYNTQFCLIPKGQEDILYDSRYPLENQMAQKFWGGKPPL